jgi:hypothetical protein
MATAMDKKKHQHLARQIASTVKWNAGRNKGIYFLHGLHANVDDDALVLCVGGIQDDIPDEPRFY